MLTVSTAHALLNVSKNGRLSVTVLDLGGKSGAYIVVGDGVGRTVTKVGRDPMALPDGARLWFNAPELRQAYLEVHPRNVIASGGATPFQPQYDSQVSRLAACTAVSWPGRAACACTSGTRGTSGACGAVAPGRAAYSAYTHNCYTILTNEAAAQRLYAAARRCFVSIACWRCVPLWRRRLPCLQTALAHAQALDEDEDVIAAAPPAAPAGASPAAWALLHLRFDASALTGVYACRLRRRYTWCYTVCRR